jgi:hypothetical protein
VLKRVEKCDYTDSEEDYDTKSELTDEETYYDGESSYISSIEYDTDETNFQAYLMEVWILDILKF